MKRILNSLLIFGILALPILEGCGGGGGGGIGWFGWGNPQPTYSPVVVNGVVYAVAVAPDGTTYLGGRFDRIGKASGYGVLFDAAGAALAAFPTVNGAIAAVAPDEAGGWYIGGAFTKVGATSRRYLAHVLADGTVDPAWDPNPNNTVNAVCVSGGKVYVGGRFNGANSIGGANRNRIAAVDPATGNADAQWNPGANNTVMTIAARGNWVYAGGLFTTIGGQTRQRIAALQIANGANTGTADPSWAPDANDGVYSVATNNTHVYIGGTFTTLAGGTLRNRIAAISLATGSSAATIDADWDPDATGTGVFAIAASDTQVFAGGWFTSIGGAARSGLALLAPANGANAGDADASWNPQPAGALAGGNTLVRTLVLIGTKLYVGGSFTTIGGQSRNNLAVLSTTGTGTADAAWDPDVNNMVAAIAVSGDTVYAGGSFSSVKAQTRVNLAAVDSLGNITSWAPNPDDEVYALAYSGGKVYAGGFFNTIGGGASSRVAALDAGTGLVDGSWSSPTVAGFVSALAIGNNRVYIGGWIMTVGGTTRNHLAALDAATGSLDATWDPDANDSVTALAFAGGKVYIGGQFTTLAGGTTRNRLAAVDAASGALDGTWNPDADNIVNSLSVSGSTVYAGGAFTSFKGGTVARNYLAAFNLANGDDGSPLAWDPSADNAVYAVAAAGSKVYFGGAFTAVNVNGAAAVRSRIAAVDAVTGLVDANWQPEADQDVRALAAGSGAVFAGGTFSTIDGGPYSFFARIAQ